ncbi:hypothetical protein I3760_08G107300 [Carya illinoinensis]|nr:hypothetical protein I3760_08G107300 [Carya illinoinensis]
MVENILENFPEAVYDLDSSMENIVLLSVEHDKQRHVYELLVNNKKKVIPDSLFWEVDQEGNTALHLTAKEANSNTWPVPGPAFQMNWEIKWFEDVQRSMPEWYPFPCNKAGETPREVFTKSHKFLVKQGQEWLTSISVQACPIATGLLVAVAFSTSSSSNDRFNFKDPKLQGLERPSAVSYSLLIPAGAFFFSVLVVFCFLLIIGSAYSESSFCTGNKLMVFLLGLAAFYLSVVNTLESFTLGRFLLAINELDTSNYLPGYISFGAGYYIIVLMIPMPFYLHLAWAIFRGPHTMNLVILGFFSTKSYVIRA